jgi:hypothetical protein
MYGLQAGIEQIPWGFRNRRDGSSRLDPRDFLVRVVVPADFGYEQGCSEFVNHAIEPLIE